MIGVVYSGGAKRNLAHEALEMHINQLIKLKAAWRSVFFWWAGKRRRSVYEKHLARRSTYFIYVHIYMYIMHSLYGHRWVLIYICKSLWQHIQTSETISTSFFFHTTFVLERFVYYESYIAPLIIHSHMWKIIGQSSISTSQISINQEQEWTIWDIYTKPTGACFKNRY